jgi:hypothetical protein
MAGESGTVNTRQISQLNRTDTAHGYILCYKNATASSWCSEQMSVHGDSPDDSAATTG